MRDRKFSLVFATNNAYKLEEIEVLCPENIRLLKLSDILCEDDIPETGTTLSDNASQKAWFIYNKYSLNCFADDTGLEIDALNGAPGVYSARYAGDMRDSLRNMALVLDQMNGVDNRRARFRTIISLIIDNKEFQFEGIVNGVISKQPYGDHGFGYDPIFIPDGYDVTFAQLDLAIKNKISHRGRAVAKLINFLQEMFKQTI